MEQLLKTIVEGLVSSALPDSKVKVTKIKWTPKNA